MKEVGILVVADGLGDDIRNRFKASIRFSKPRASYDVHIMGGKERRAKGVPFNKCKLLNQGLRTMFDIGYQVIIQADIDLIVPPVLVDKTYELAMRDKLCIHQSMRRISADEYNKYKEYRSFPFNQWKKIKAIYATGCWNGIIMSNWKLTGGFNEDMIEWGYEDRDWRERCIRVGVRWKDVHKFPLMHVDHPNRTKNVSLRNVEVGKRAKREERQNWL